MISLPLTFKTRKLRMMVQDINLLQILPRKATARLSKAVLGS